VTLRAAVRLLALALTAWAIAGTDVSAQRGAAPDALVAAQAAEQPADDPWGFEEEEEAVPTLGELARTQAPDLLLFGAFAILVMVSFFLKSDRLKVVTLVASVAYLGFYKSQLLSVTNIFALLSMNLPLFSYSMGWYFFAVFSIATTILWGRIYCGRICAFGSLTQLMDRVLPARLRVNVPRSIERRAGYIKYGLLAFVVIYYLTTRDIRIYRAVEPFWMFTLQGSTVMWVGLTVLLVATVFVRNLYCRFLCPVGAFLGLLSNLTVFRIKRWSECSTCRICEKTCEWGAIRGPKIIASECVRCDDCERLYMNKKKCPHWLIIERKEVVMARRSAAAAASGGS
jgi:polyferredoxin